MNPCNHLIWRCLAALSLVLLAACSKEPYKQESYVFGTRVEIAIQDEDENKAKQAAAAVLADLDQLHKRLHAWQPSEVTRLNEAFAMSGQPQTVAPDLLQLLRDSRRYESWSKGLFNPAIGGLVRTWGFQADTFEPKLPDETEIKRWVAAKPALQTLAIGDKTIASHNTANQLDLGGVVKGWALDREAALLRKMGIKNALLNIGGNIMALGKKGHRAWVVGIQHPRKNGPIATITLNDGEAIGTSGDYQRYFELEGKRYHHLIDPRTGYPAQGVQSVTVVLPAGEQAGLLSDILTKPLFIDGPGNARDYMKQFQVQDVLLIDAAGKVHASETMQKRLDWEDDKPSVLPLP
ncbi:thiamine biosynthesis lipoprotein [Chitinivorax tropicus]|uniref:FAD:protein FMN transferase n=1 Tax=Chitinivorax tropicus TaxID=714531 RepID=A0A840MLJ7_9PROT|nr:FAD:protein FMN transferase [Chitinivorax tropicus]MBB5017063.1 thiamine biosynthesis lipoprotein [Chitinivorax tropicus]